MVVTYHTSGKYDLCSNSFVFLLDESECECRGGAQGGAEGEERILSRLYPQHRAQGCGARSHDLEIDPSGNQESDP